MNVDFYYQSPFLEINNYPDSLDSMHCEEYFSSIRPSIRESEIEDLPPDENVHLSQIFSTKNFETKLMGSVNERNKELCRTKKDQFTVKKYVSQVDNKVIEWIDLASSAPTMVQHPKNIKKDIGYHEIGKIDHSQNQLTTQRDKQTEMGCITEDIRDKLGDQNYTMDCNFTLNDSPKKNCQNIFTNPELHQKLKEINLNGFLNFQHLNRLLKSNANVPQNEKIKPNKNVFGYNHPQNFMANWNQNNPMEEIVEIELEDLKDFSIAEYMYNPMNYESTLQIQDP